MSKHSNMAGSFIILGRSILMLLGALAALAGMLLWLWFSSIHPTTERMQSAVGSIIENHAESLPYGEANLLSTKLGECAEVRIENYQIPFKSRVIELYGLFGFKEADDGPVRATAQEVVDYCARSFVSDVDTTVEVRARQNLLDRAGLIIPADRAGTAAGSS